MTQSLVTELVWAKQQKTQNIPTTTKNKQRNFEYLQNLAKIYQNLWKRILHETST